MVATKLSYVRLVAVELVAFLRRRQHRTKPHIIQEYANWRVDLAQTVLTVDPAGRFDHTREGDARQQNWRRILEGLAELGVENGTVLEIGGGDGTNIRGLRQLAPQIRWIACDLVPRSNDVICGDATALPFSPGSVEAVVTYYALEQMPGDASY